MNDRPSWALLTVLVGTTACGVPGVETISHLDDGGAGPGSQVVADTGAGGGSSDTADGSPAISCESKTGAPVLLSEIMYHPIADDAPDSTFEFVEIYNNTRNPLALAGWRLDGSLRYSFGAGASIAGGQRLVIAKNKQRLIDTYHLAADGVFGDSDGELDNGGGVVALIDAAGETADCLRYDDKAPWPIAADALGAKAEWYAAGDRRIALLADPSYRGVSLERISFDVPATEISNWGASSLEGATPGKANSTAGTPRPIVLAVTAANKASSPLIHKEDEVTIRAVFSTLGSVSDVAVEYFVDDPQRASEPTTTLSMTRQADGWEVVLPTQDDNAIVRYRISATRGQKAEVVSPRPSDPIAWHAYFVAPAIKPESPAYHLFIASTDWGRLWISAGGLATNDGTESYVAARRTSGPLGTEEAGCTLRPEFDDDVPAVFVEGGVVHDVRVRYQGSRFNRLRGEQLKTWLPPGPSAGPNPPLILAWHVAFPRYRPFETVLSGDKVKRSAINIKKGIHWGCQSFPNYVANRVMESVGLSSARVKFVRLHVNGAYYAYMTDEGPADESTALAVEPPGTKVVGNLFKANGSSDEGPFARTDASPLGDNPMCPGRYPIWQRYQYNYERQTYGWKEKAIARDPKHPPDLAQTLIEGLEKARLEDLAAGAGKVDSRKKYLADNFDLDKLRDYIAIRNWAGPFDDAHHNYNLYKRSSDGKWVVIGWDFEFEYGGLPFFRGGQPQIMPSMSFYVGEEGDRSARPETATTNYWNRIKDAYIKSYRSELNRRLRELSSSGQILSPSVFTAVVDDLIQTAFNAGDWNEVAIRPPPPDRYPTTYQCKPRDYFDGMKAWVRDRNKEVTRQITAM